MVAGGGIQANETVCTASIKLTVAK